MGISLVIMGPRVEGSGLSTPRRVFKRTTKLKPFRILPFRLTGSCCIIGFTSSWSTRQETILEKVRKLVSFWTKHSLGKITLSMWVAKSVVGLSSYLGYEHALRWKLLNKYITHSCSHYLTMLMLLGVKSQKDVAKSSGVYKIMQLELYFEEKLQKMLFTC